jgi:hypothetical protein
MDREQFRRLVDDRVRRIAGVALDDLADVSLDDWLDDEDAIDDGVAPGAALDAAVEILDAEGIDEEVLEHGRRIFGDVDQEDDE